MVIKSNQKSKFTDHDEDSNESWLMTYADTITNLLGFFVLIVAFSTLDKNKFAQFSDSVKEQLTNEQSTNSLEKLQLQLDSLFQKQKASGAIDINMDSKGVTMIANNASFFNSGEALLLPEGVNIINQVSQKLKSIDDDFNVEVEGHTDDAPISTTQFQSNWELSSARSSNVVKYLIQNGIPPNRIKASAFAETRPRLPNRDKKGQPISKNMSANRRVVIRVFY